MKIRKRTRSIAAPTAAAVVLALAGGAYAQLSVGPDIVYQDMTSTSQYTAIGGVRAYALGSNTCNRGNQNALWTNNATPGLAMNLYRIHDGRLVQLGQSWVKTACCAAASNGCGLGCNGANGSQLGVGCLDVYGAGWNGSQTRLAPRSGINPWTGVYAPIPSASHNSINRRLQVQTTDLQLTSFPGALYFAEGVYVATDEHNVNNHLNKLNNASHKRVTFNQTSFNMDIPAGTPMQATVPAIQAWRDHGLGLNTPDPTVTIQTVDVPAEGRFYVGHKVKDNGNGTWRYEYAVFNLNSHQAGGSFSLPTNGATVTNIGFRDVPYHSGEPYDNTDWVVNAGPSEVTWTSPQTFAQNPNSNALRWGTMYNFWFDADQPPADGDAALGLFRTPATTLNATVGVPAGGAECRPDWNNDDAVNSSDISAFLTGWLASLTAPDLVADYNEDGAVNSADISAFLTAWVDAVTNGC